MSVAPASAPRDELAENEVKRLARIGSVFNTWVSVVFVIILIAILGFFVLTGFDSSFLFRVCVATAGQECAPGTGPSGILQLGPYAVYWSGWLFFIMAGIPMTLFVSVMSIVLAVILALIGALGRLSKNPLFYGPATFYISLFRGIPLLVQIFIWYLALPQIKIPGLFPTGIVIPSVPAGILALGACYGAYMTETFRAGIISISKGQTEAALALGMSSRQVLTRVILPQALRVVIPPIGNDFITMTKDSSLVSTMSVWELLYRASKIGRQYFRSFETLIIAALFYWIMTITLQYFQSKLEARMARGDR
jgi:polar amino acid transport system permease protein